MALYDIRFKHTEIYYCTETIEADSLEEAEGIAGRLLGSIDFEDELVGAAVYDDHEDSFIGANEVEQPEHGWQRHATIDVSDFIDDEE
jgi:hypothetical protein